MEQYEKLGAFYLGRPYDQAAGKAGSGVLLYDSRDLLTHGVCVGMTGSGKTGLCMALLEEAAMDGIPALVIDPKGDMANLLLAFPDLAPSDFRPWIDEDDARRQGLTPDELAAKTAAKWREGLAAWDQDGERIRRMRERVDLALYTPGSNAGLPVSILRSFAAPAPEVLSDEELLQEQASGAATSLLGLAGVQADPVRSREHILLSTLLLHTWRAGADADLPGLIRMIQEPPLRQVGVLDLETFFPARDRTDLALRFNNLLASPGFSLWLQGKPLAIGPMLHSPSGKPRISIFSIAHLDDAQRMFFVSLLLNQVVGWVRTQPGTTSLRAILYMDEIFGFFPPVAEPPSKRPLLTLLKQARAHGLGVMLTTQNPVDLDYKGLANAGTWFIGRLQTDRDRQRVLDGLEGASASQGGRFDRAEMERILAGLGNRVFLLHNVHEDAPVLFETRWCMSYLAGPMTRSRIQLLAATGRLVPETVGVQPAAPQAPGPSAAAAAVAAAATVTSAAAVASPVVSAAAASGGPPSLPAGIRQLFLPIRGALGDPAALVYRPAILGIGQVGYRDTKTGLQAEQAVVAVTAVTGEVVPVDWDKATEIAMDPGDLDTQPVDGARFAPIPQGISLPRDLEDFGRDYANWMYRTRTLTLLKSEPLKLAAAPGESEADFRIRLQQRTREVRDQEIEVLRAKYAVRMKSLEERIRKSEQALEREKQQAAQSNVQTAISIGATILSSLLGKKALNATAVGKATTAMRGASRSMKEKGDVSRSQETVETYRTQLQELETAFREETDALALRLDPANPPVTETILRPVKKDILVKGTALAWLPWRTAPDGAETAAWEA